MHFNRFDSGGGGRFPQADKAKLTNLGEPHPGALSIRRFSDLQASVLPSDSASDADESYAKLIHGTHFPCD